MHIHLVRHAHAGARSHFEGDDRDRPLTAEGRAQAEAVGAALAAGPDRIDELWSSPYLRCLETLGPLARRTGLTVRHDDLLAEGAWGSVALDALLAAAAEGRTVVACSHGDVIPALVGTAVRRGAELVGPATPRKGGRHDLLVVNGIVARVTYVERPEV